MFTTSDLDWRFTFQQDNDSKHAAKKTERFQNNLWMLLNGWKRVLTSIQLSLFGDTDIHHPTSQNWRWTAGRNSQKSQIQEWKPYWMICKKTRRCRGCRRCFYQIKRESKWVWILITMWCFTVYFVANLQNISRLQYWDLEQGKDKLIDFSTWLRVKNSIEPEYFPKPLYNHDVFKCWNL